MKSSLTGAIHIAIAASAFAATAVNAEQTNGFTIVPSIGYSMFDRDLTLENDYHGSLGIGYKCTSPWAIELVYQHGSPSIENTVHDIDLEQIRLDALYHFAANGQVQPFLLMGAGEERRQYGNTTADNSMINAGAGLKIQFSERVSLRTDMRISNDMDNELTSYAVNVGFNFLVGGSAPAKQPIENTVADSDDDGVADGQDRCPGTAAAVTVDNYGCELKTDDDQDGVANAVDACPDTSPGARVDTKGCYVTITQTKEISLRVGFELNSFNVTPDSYEDIEAVAQFMREYPLTDVNIEGHTDDTGAAAYNQQLSQKRAEAVAKVLTDRFGIDSSRVSATGYGESQPIVANDSAENRARNRRVTAKITARVERVQK